MIRVVKAGYARNYLMPQNLAILFTKKQIKSIEEAKKLEDRKLEMQKDKLLSIIKDIEMQKDKLLSIIKDIEKLNLSIKMKSEEGEKLFGSVTKVDIVKLLQENNIEIDKKYIDLSSPIKTLGEHKIGIIFTADIAGSLSLMVEKEV